jgi:hypothetical protein
MDYMTHGEHWQVDQGLAAGRWRFAATAVGTP